MLPTYHLFLWRCSGLMVHKCASLRIKQSRFEPRPGTLCCVLGQNTLLSQCIFPPSCIHSFGVCKSNVRGNLQWTSIPSRGSRHIPSYFVLQKPEMRAGLMGHLPSMQTLPIIFSRKNIPVALTEITCKSDLEMWSPLPPVLHKISY